MIVRRPRRLVTSLGLLAFTVLSATSGPAPARAQSTTTSTEAPAALECETARTSNDLSIRYCRPANETSSTSTFPLRVEVTNTRATLVRDDYEVTAISVEIAPTEPDQRVPEPASKDWEGPPARRGSLEWSPRFATNGTYDLRIIARGDGPGGQSATATVPMRLAAPPHAPTAVKVGKTDDGSVLVSWSNTDREPDVYYYEVRRAAEGSASSELIATVESSQVPRVVDEPGVGSWRYRVVAFRRGASDDSPGVSSSPAAASIDVTSASTSDAGSPSDGTTTGSGATGSGSGSGSAAGPGTGSAAGGSSGSTSTTRPGVTTGGRSGVALGTITTTPGGRRATATTVRRTERDPGFDETLPFDVPPRRTEVVPVPQQDPAPLELGTEDEVAGQDLISDDAGERRRSLGFVAGGLLLFVLGMTGLFLKAEVRRVDELEALDVPAAPPTPDAAPVAAASVAQAPAPAVPIEAPAAAAAAVAAPAAPVPPAAAPAPAPGPVTTDEDDRSGVADDAGLLTAVPVAAVAAAGRRPRIPRRGGAGVVALTGGASSSPDEEVEMAPAPAARRPRSLIPRRSDIAPAAARASGGIDVTSDATEVEADVAAAAPDEPRRRRRPSPLNPVVAAAVRTDAGAADRPAPGAEPAETPGAELLTTPPWSGTSPGSTGAGVVPARGRRRRALDSVASTAPEDATAAAATPTAEPARPSTTAALPVALAATADEPMDPAPAPAPAPRRRSRSDGRAQRAEELATLFGDDRVTEADDDRHLADLAAALEPTAAARPASGRVRRTVAPVDAPGLDVPDPPAPTSAATSTAATPARRSPASPAAATTRTRTTDRARRAPTRLPSRPADDRRQGGAAVRPGRRGTGQGDRRLPVG